MFTDSFDTAKINDITIGTDLIHGPTTTAADRQSVVVAMQSLSKARERDEMSSVEFEGVFGDVDFKGGCV